MINSEAERAGCGMRPTLLTGEGAARVLKGCIADSENRALAAVVTRVLAAAVGDDRARGAITAITGSGSPTFMSCRAMLRSLLAVSAGRGRSAPCARRSRGRDRGVALHRQRRVRRQRQRAACGTA